jgi:hypothetical protein
MASKNQDGRRGQKRKHVTLNLAKKLEIIKRLESGEGRSKLMQEYNIASSALYNIKAHKEQLLEFATDSETYRSIKKRRSLHKPKMEQLDKVLYEWFTMRRSEGISITEPLLIEKANTFVLK